MISFELRALLVQIIVHSVKLASFGWGHRRCSTVLVAVTYTLASVATSTAWTTIISLGVLIILIVPIDATCCFKWRILLRGEGSARHVRSCGWHSSLVVRRCWACTIEATIRTWYLVGLAIWIVASCAAWGAAIINIRHWIKFLNYKIALITYVLSTY